MSTTSVPSLKGVQEALATSRNELCRLDIPKLDQALARFEKLLEYSKKSNESQAAVNQRVNLANRLYQAALKPILEAKRNPSFSISNELTTTLCTLFSALDEAIPKIETSLIHYLWGRVDMNAIGSGVNSKIEGVLDAFLERGVIKQMEGCHLVQARQLPAEESTTGSQLTSPISQRPDALILGTGPENASGSAAPIASGPDLTLDLAPQIRLALSKCPKFRILLLGKSGAGKSSLINKFFGVTSASVSDFKAGIAEIDQEHKSEQNQYFVLHDSMGFESGSPEKYDIVKKFIMDRSKKTKLSEKLHAIWLCAPVPVSGGRVFETGDEQIFQLPLGDVPLIIVFTKFDNLVASVEKDTDLDDDLEIRAEANKRFQQICTYPLEQLRAQESMPKEFPSVKVSAVDGYGDTLSELARLTLNLLPLDASDQTMDDSKEQTSSFPASSSPNPPLKPSPNGGEPSPQRQPMSSAGITFAVAQRADPKLKIDAVIAVGRQKYWRSLTSSLEFTGKPLDKCIAVVHSDIVQVWNFLDPADHLGEKLKGMMSQLVDDLVDHGASCPTKDFVSHVSGAAGITGIVGAIAPPGALVVGPIAFTAAVAKWVYDIYRQTPGVVRCLMGYIVDLTIVMRRLFWLMQIKGGIYPVQEKFVQQAVKEYTESNLRVEIHRDIREFVRKIGAVQAVRKDVVVGKVEQLIRDNSFNPDLS